MKIEIFDMERMHSTLENIVEYDILIMLPNDRRHIQEYRQAGRRVHGRGLQGLVISRLSTTRTSQNQKGLVRKLQITNPKSQTNYKFQ